MTLLGTHSESPEQANVNCSENIAYGTNTNTDKKDPVGDISTCHAVVYDEVLTSSN